jgi:hypothetical protein
MKYPGERHTCFPEGVILTGVISSETVSCSDNGGVMGTGYRLHSGESHKGVEGFVGAEGVKRDTRISQAKGQSRIGDGLLLGLFISGGRVSCLFFVPRCARMHKKRLDHTYCS